MNEVTSFFLQLLVLRLAISAWVEDDDANDVEFVDLVLDVVQPPLLVDLEIIELVLEDILRLEDVEVDGLL